MPSVFTATSADSVAVTRNGSQCHVSVAVCLGVSLPAPLKCLDSVRLDRAQFTTVRRAYGPLMRRHFNKARDVRGVSLSCLLFLLVRGGSVFGGVVDVDISLVQHIISHSSTRSWLAGGHDIPATPATREVLMASIAW